jgi:scyllo-inositol 2-dehydrogenase (NADP+)
MKNHQPIQTGLLSYGMSGRVFHAPFLRLSPLFHWHAVVERTHKLAKQLEPSVKSYDAVDELLADPEIELVIVNTPNNTHYELALNALYAGKHVLVEKPFAPTSDEAAHLLEVGDQVGKKVLVYQNRRWDSDFRSLQNVLQSGVCGKPMELHLRFDRYRPAKSAKLFKETPLPASGVLFDLGAHLLDQAIALFGIPDQSIKLTSMQRPDTEVDDVSSLILTYKEGLIVYIHASLLTAEELPAFVLHGSKGSFQKTRSDVQEMQLQAGMLPSNPRFGVEASGKEGKLTLITGENRPIYTYMDSLKGNYQGIFDAVYDTIRHDAPYPISKEQLLAQIKILESPSFNQG